MNDLARTLLMFVVGLAGGLVGALFLGSDRGASQHSASESVYAADPLLKALDQRIMELESGAAAQQLAFEDLNGRLLNASRRPDPSALALAQPAGAADAFNFADMPSGPGMDAMVEAVIVQREERERAEREAERATRRAERVAELTQRMTTEMGLDASQSQVVSSALSESWAAREAMFAGFQDGRGMTMDREAIGKQMTEIRNKEMAAVGSVLTPAQVETYSSLSDFGRGFGGGSGGGRGQTGGDTTSGQTRGRTGGGNGRDF